MGKSPERIKLDNALNDACIVLIEYTRKRRPDLDTPEKMIKFLSKNRDAVEKRYREAIRAKKYVW